MALPLHRKQAEQDRTRVDFAPRCSGRPKAVGLRDDLDDSDVLVCKAHYGRLRKLDERSADELERYVKRAFGREIAAVG